MNQNQYSDDLAHIRTMMERSSRFLSLSGWAGILPGIFALMGLALAVWFISKAQNFWWFGNEIDRSSPLTWQVIAIAMIVLGLSIFSSWYTCMRKARKENQSTWTPAIRNMLLHFAIPLSAGAIIVGWIYVKGEWGLLAPVMLSFYGLALIQVSQFTLKSVFWLGIIEIALSIPSGIPGLGIPMLAVGFGFAHIVYGIMMLPLTPTSTPLSTSPKGD